MPPIVDSPSPYIARLQDSLLSNSAIRGDLNDDEAQPLLDWGFNQAQQIGAVVADDDDFEVKRDALSGFLKSVARYVLRHQENDETWRQSTLQRLDEYSQAFNGPVLSEATRQTFLQAGEITPLELLNKMLSAYSPPPAVSPIVSKLF